MGGNVHSVDNSNGDCKMTYNQALTALVKVGIKKFPIGTQYALVLIIVAKHQIEY